LRQQLKAFLRVLSVIWYKPSLAITL